MKRPSGFALGVLAAFAVLSAPASAAFERSVALHDGNNAVVLTVPHRTGNLPPAILLSVSPPSGRCAASAFTYRAVERSGRMRVHLHCRALAGRPRARFRFRSPYVSSFRLTEGTATVRLEADKPPGDVSPLGALRTNVRRAACTAAPGRPVITDATFTATARVTCDDLSAHARGSLALGGLLAPGGAGATATAAASPPATSASPDARAASACRPELNLTVVGRNVISAVRCDSNRRTIRPFETLRIPQDLDLGSCPDSEPSPWPLPPQTVHVEGDIPYSYALRLVTNWSLDRSGEVFLRYTCIKVPL